ncbi:MAG: M23 family metallopeptidase [Actinomycetota bacterium]
MTSSGTDCPRGVHHSAISVTTGKVLVGVLSALAVGTASLNASAQTTTVAPDPTTTTVATPAETTAAPSETTAAPAETTAAPTETTAPAAPSTVDPNAQPTTTAAPQSAEERARAVANLNLAKSADVEIAARLNIINEEANATLDKIESARKRIEVAQEIARRTQADLAESGEERREIENSLALKAVEGFKTRSIEGAGALLNAEDGTQSLRQNQLLDQASVSTTELLEELRVLLEDQRLATAEAERAERDARVAEKELEAELEILKDQQTEQLGLKAEAERRIDQWAGELTAYAREDAAIQELIGQSAAVVDTAINTPTTPSALGFQWPVVDGRVTSEYGYRIHPVYGTRRLHAGIDIGAARGVPIASSNDGVVIFAGTQGGYGRTVIIDHGGGITTLYAHMSEIGAVEGQLVDRGDIVGFVGASGTATGNHLHFEVRINGGPSNPRNYLP